MTLSSHLIRPKCHYRYYQCHFGHTHYKTECLKHITLWIQYMLNMQVRWNPLFQAGSPVKRTSRITAPRTVRELTDPRKQTYTALHVNWSIESEIAIQRSLLLVLVCIRQIDLADNCGRNCTSHSILRWESARSPHHICATARQSNRVHVSVKNPFVFRNKTFPPSLIMG